MEEIKSIMKEHRMLSQASLHIYSQTVKKLCRELTGESFQNTEFLLDVDKVLDCIKNKSLSTKKNYLSAVLVFLNPTGNSEDVATDLEPIIQKYNNLLKNFHTQYMDHVNEQHKSAKESKNWVSMNDLLKINVKYKNKVRRLGITSNSLKINDKEKLDTLQRYLVSSLYLFHPPRRCEYSDTDIISQRDYNNLSENVKENHNFLVVGGRSAKKKFFSFGNYKNKKHMGLQRIEIKKNLNTVLNLWIKHNPSKHLLLDSRGRQMSRNSLTKYLYKVFESSNANISANMLRHIYLSEKYGHESKYKEKQSDANAMGHSVQTQQQHYVKTD